MMNIYQKKYLGWVKHGKTRRRGQIKKGSKCTNQPLVLDADTQQQPTNVTGAVEEDEWSAHWNDSIFWLLPRINQNREVWNPDISFH